jgi:hypothetical protein
MCAKPEVRDTFDRLAREHDLKLRVISDWSSTPPGHEGPDRSLSEPSAS